MSPFSKDINPITAEGSKLHLKATEELNPDQKIQATIEKSHEVRNHLQICRTKFAWGQLLSLVPNASDMNQDVIRNHKVIATDDALRFSNTYFGDGTRNMPPLSRIMLDLDPANDPDHKEMF